MEIVSDGKNIAKVPQGFNGKKFVLVLWDANEVRNGLPSKSIVKVPKNLFNEKAQRSWRIEINL